MREGAYSWSMERLKDSQGAYAWSKDVVLQAQSLGQQRLQSLGLLPGWLTRASVAESGEGVRADDADGGEAVWAWALLVAWNLESVGPAAFALTAAGAAAATAGALPLAALATPSAAALGAAWVGAEATFYLVCCAVAARASRRRRTTSRTSVRASISTNT